MKKILIIDDTPAVGKMLGRFLETIDRECIICTTPQEGIQTFRREKESLGLVVTDIQMPSGTEGIEMIQAIDGDLGAVPVVFLSSAADRLRSAQLHCPKAAGFFEKPIGLDKFCEIVEQLT